MKVFIHVNPTTMRGYTIKRSTEEEQRIHRAGGELLVPFDKDNPSHLGFKPGDVYDGNGSFTVPRLDPALRQAAMDAVKDAPLREELVREIREARNVDDLPRAVHHLVGDRRWKPHPSLVE